MWSLMDLTNLLDVESPCLREKRHILMHFTKVKSTHFHFSDNINTQSVEEK